MILRYLRSSSPFIGGLLLVALIVLVAEVHGSSSSSSNINNNLLNNANNDRGLQQQQVPDYEVPYEETVETYVDFPTDSVSQALIAKQPFIEKVHLALWTTVDDFEHPLFHLVKGIVRRLDKELLVFQPSYYLRDGANVGCRVINPLTQQDEDNTPNNPICAENCTNFGRYCAGSEPTDPNLAARTNGADIVTESLRQLCVWVVYGKTGGDNMLHFFRYINDVLLKSCDNPFSKSCTYPVMDRINVSPHFIERCMNHTHGLDEDSANPYLHDQIEKSKDITSAMVPRLKIGNYWYNGVESTAEIFRAVCAAYPADKQPLACQFCKNCNDVRYCLWHLQCNGQTFEMFAAAGAGSSSSNYVSPAEQEAALTNTIVPAPAPAPAPSPADTSVTTTTTTTPAPSSSTIDNNLLPNNNDNDDTSSSSSNTDSNSNNKHEAKNAAQDALISGIAVGLALGLTVSAIYGCKDWQAKIILREIQKEDRLMASIKQAETTDTAPASPEEDEEIVSPTSAAGMLRKLRDIEAMIDGGKDVGDLLDVVSERTGRSIKSRVET